MIQSLEQLRAPSEDRAASRLAVAVAHCLTYASRKAKVGSGRKNINTYTIEPILKIIIFVR